jgi:GH24 family phage-related lysozyme (muramidase)
LSTAKKVDAVDSSLSGMSAVDLLGSIFQELKKQEIERRFESELNRRFQEETNTEEELRNRELIKAITGRRPEKKTEESKTRAKKEELAEVPKITKPEAKKAPGKTTPKAPTAPAPKAPTAPAPKAPTAPAPKAPTAPAPKAPTTATKTPAATAPKPPTTPPKVSGAPVIPEAAKVAVGAVAAGGFFALASSVIVKEEGFPKNGKAYWDPPNHKDKLVSIGYGHQIQPEEYKQGYIQAGDEKVLIKGERGIDTIMTLQQAKKLFEIDLPKYAAVAKKPLGESWEKLTDEQKTALTSYAYNVGSTVSLVKAGIKTAIDKGDTQEAARIISEKGIRTASGKFNAALDKRRKKEAELFASTKIKQLPPPLTTVSQSSGTKINNASVENTQLHESLNNTRPQVIVNQTTESNSKTNKVQDKSTPQDDRPVWKKK